jgi:hypothetical protein
MRNKRNEATNGEVEYPEYLGDLSSAPDQGPGACTPGTREDAGAPAVERPDDGVRRHGEVRIGLLTRANRRRFPGGCRSGGTRRSAPCLLTPHRRNETEHRRA